VSKINRIRDYSHPKHTKNSVRGVLTVCVLLLFFCTPLFAYQKGVVLGLYSKDPQHSYAEDLVEIKKLGADHVSLVVSWYQKDSSANEIYPRYKPFEDFNTTPDLKIIKVIQQAQKRGLKIFLFPILRIEERKEKEWRGNIHPKDLQLWLKNYQNFTLHYARLAEKYHVTLFSIGSELCSVENQTQFWNNLIASIRQFYKGQLIYSANWDHYKKIDFWDKLDFLGLNGYYELADNSKPKLQDVIRKWWDIENEISAWQEHHHKPLIFTEIGYPSMDGTCQKPWDYTRNAPVDLEEQALCYEAFFLSWEKSQKLGGVYFWNWYGQGGVNDRSYTPRGKPAEKVLTKWYRNIPLSSPSSPLVSSPAAEPKPTAISLTAPRSSS